MTQPGAKRWWIALAMAVPLAWTLLLAIDSGRIPHRDYWDMQEEFFSSEGFSGRASDWLTANRSHLMPVTYLTYAANIVLTDGSNRGLTLLAWTLAAVQLLLLARLARASGLNAGWLPVLAAFSFTPVAADIWTMGFSGVHNMGPQCLAVASIYCWTAPSLADRAGYRALGIVLASLAALTFSTGLPASAIAVVALVWRRERWPWTLAAAGCFAGLLLLRSTMVDAFYAPQLAPELRLPDPLAALRYFLPLLGGIFSQTIEVGGAFAAVGIALASVVAWKERHEARSRAWILLLLVALMQASLITVGRWHNGPFQGVASRYAPVAALFWLSTMCLLGVRTRGGAARIALIAAVLAQIAAMSVLGWQYGRTSLHRDSLQTAATLSLQYGVPDIEAIDISITPWAHQFMRNRPALEARHLVPFDRPPPEAWGSRRLEARHAQPQPGNGESLRLQRFREGGIRMVAFQPERGGSLILANGSGELRGSAEPLRFAPYRDVVWVGYARVTADDRVLRVVRIREGEPPVLLEEVQLASLLLDKRGLQVFKKIRDLPRLHRAGKSLFSRRQRALR